MKATEADLLLAYRKAVAAELATTEAWLRAIFDLLEKTTTLLEDNCEGIKEVGYWTKEEKDIYTKCKSFLKPQENS